jgi:hypothetical protein
LACDGQNPTYASRNGGLLKDDKLLDLTSALNVGAATKLYGIFLPVPGFDILEQLLNWLTDGHDTHRVGVCLVEDGVYAVDIAGVWKVDFA